MSEEAADIAYLWDSDANDLVGLDAVKRAEFLGFVEELGMVEPAGAMVGLTIADIQNAMEGDSRLQTDILLAVGRYKANFLRRMNHLAFEGSEKMVVGGKDRNIPIGVDVIPNDAALKLLAQMKFGDDLAIVTRQRIEAEMKPSGSDQVQADFSQLTGDERKDMARLMKKAQKQKKLMKEVKPDGE
jgi:hypothetical protein